MNDKIIEYFIDLMKIQRKEKGFSLENMSSMVKLDKGYLSKIENKIVEPSLEILTSCLKSLGIDLIVKELILLEMDKNLNDLYYNIVYLNRLDSKHIDATIFSKEEQYMSSLVIDKYLIFKYVYLITIHEKAEHVICLEKLIEKKLIRFNLIQPYLLQIYYDYQGTRLKNNHELKKAVEVYEKSKSIGNFKYSYGMVCYHLAMIYSRLNNYLEAYNNVTESLSVFLREFNFKRQKYSQIHLANIYSVSKQYIKANDLYHDLLKCELEDNFRYMVNLNLIWNQIKQEKFSNSIIMLVPMMEEYKVKLKWYYFMSWCYYKTCKNEEAIKIINDSKYICINDEINRSKIRIIELLITEINKKKMLNLIKIEYQNLKMKMDDEDKKFYLTILVEESGKIACYKESNIYLHELLQL